MFSTIGYVFGMLALMFFIMIFLFMYNITKLNDALVMKTGDVENIKMKLVVSNEIVTIFSQLACFSFMFCVASIGFDKLGKKGAQMMPQYPQMGYQQQYSATPTTSS
jgi:hypothetical protein